MFKDNTLILKRFNGDEIYGYTDGEYMYWLEGTRSEPRYNHSFEIFFNSVLNSLPDSVCEGCGGTHIDIKISSNKTALAKIPSNKKISFSGSYEKENEEVIGHLVCCEHIQLDDFTIEIIERNDADAIVEIYGELWGPSYFGQDKDRTKLYCRAKIPVVEELD